MKEFEKFYEGEKGNSPSDLRILSMTASTFPREFAKIYWEAALECVRDEMLSNCHEPMDIYDFIEEELNEIS